MKKNQIIILVVLVALIIGGIFYWTTPKKAKISPKEEVIPEEIVTEEVYSLSGIVSKVDVGNNFLMVIPTGEESEVKVIITGDTKIFKVVPSTEEEGSELVTERVEITIEDIKEENQVFIKTKKNIADLKEFNDIDYIEVLMLVM